MARLFEDLRGHIAGGAAGRGKNMEGLLVHYAGETEVGYQEVGVVFRSTEEEVLRLEVTVDYAVGVEICDCRECCSDEVGSV